MGQQQILLLVLGIIIVAVAIVVGINIASSSAQVANRDQLIADLNAISFFCQEFYRKPVSMGGGGNSFVNWTIPPNFDTTGNGVFSITGTPTKTSVTMIGIGNEIGNDGVSKVKVTSVVTETSINITINN